MNNRSGMPAGRSADKSPLWDVSLSSSRSGTVASSGPGLVSIPVSTPEFPFEQQAPARTINPRVHAEIGRYRLRLAESIEDRDAACRLRFKVFNIELGKGLESSYQTGLDTDQFDLFCDHLLVEDKQASVGSARRIVGTYRLQTGNTAALNLGYYSEQEFDFAPYDAMRPEILELGRASIDREHRTPEVLTLLWRGIAQYANDMQLRYLIGCSSLNSIDPREGWHIYRQLDHSRVSRNWKRCPSLVLSAPASCRDRVPARQPRLLPSTARSPGF